MRTPRLDLPAWAPAHRALLGRLAADWRVVRYVGDGRPPGDVWVDEVHEWMLDHWRRHGFGWRAVVELATGAEVGLIALNRPREGTPGLRDDEVEIGWWLDPGGWGRGYATEAAAAARDEAFGPVGATCIAARIQPANTASVAVAERLGLSGHDEAPGRTGPSVRVMRLRAARAARR